MNSKHPLKSPTASLLLVLCCSSALAQTNGTWNSNSNGNWSDTTKWSGGNVANGAGAVATIDRTTFSAGRTITLDSSRTIGQMLAVGAPGTARAIIVSGANTLTFNNGASAAVLSNVGNGALNIQSAIALESSLDISNNPTTDQFLAISGGISSSTSGLKTVNLKASTYRINLASSISDGAGQVALAVNLGSGGEVRVTTAQAFSGGISLNSGKYRLLTGTDATSLGSGTVSFNGGSVEFATGLTTTQTNSMAIGVNGGTIETVGTAVISWAGAISGGGTLDKQGTGTLVIGAQNTFSGNITVTGGTLQTNATGTLGTADISVLSGQTLTLGNSLSLDSTSALTFDLTSIINLNYSGAMSIADLGRGATFIDDGTYTASQLNAFFGGSNFSGSGSITVVPEPRSLLLLGAGLLVLIMRRRNRASV